MRWATLALLAVAFYSPASAAAEINASQASRAASQDAKVIDQRQRNGGLTHSAAKVDGSWEVAYFADEKQVALVVVDPLTGVVRESWTGYQTTWKMARGYSGAFGHKLNAPYVFLPLCAIFLLGLLDWRRLGRVANLDLLALLAFGVVGADRIGQGEPLYDNFPADVSQGDTYGPLNYLAYVPFELIWPWSGSWDDLPAAHGAAVFFDLATFALLILLGRRIRPGSAGNKLAATLAFGWAAYPYTAFALLSNSNDTLVAMLLVATLLVLARPAARGVMVALATLAKFAPAVLAPMLATYGEKRPRFLLAFTVTAAAVMLWPALDPGLATVYDRTIAYQAGRDSPFSIWGQAPSLEPLRIVIMATVACLSLLFAFRPKDKQLFQVAALSAALLIGVQLTMQHWFYLYIVWFYPLLLVAITRLEPGPSPAQSSQPTPAR